MTEEKILELIARHDRPTSPRNPPPTEHNYRDDPFTLAAVDDAMQLDGIAKDKFHKDLKDLFSNPIFTLPALADFRSTAEARIRDCIYDFGDPSVAGSSAGNDSIWEYVDVPDQ